MALEVSNDGATRLLWAAVAGLSFGQAHLAHGLFALLGVVALGIALQQPVRRGRDWVVVGALAQGGVGLSCWGFVHFGWGVYAATIVWLAVGGALFGGLLAAVEPRQRPRPLRVALCFLAAEYVMTLGPWSFPLFLGGTQVHLPWRSSAGLIGALGVGSALVGLGASVAGAVSTRQGWRPLGVWVGGLAGVVLLGGWQPGLVEESEPIEVAVVQGAAPNWLYEAKVNSTLAERLLEARYFDGLATILAGGADIVFLPETALRRPALIREGRLLVALFQPVPDATGYVVTGAPRYEWSADNESERPWNSALLFRADDAESVLGAVDKHRLAPLVESRRWARGDAASALQAGDTAVGVLICYESMDPWLGRARAEPAGLLAILTNDAGFEESPIGVAHARQGWSRAIELGRPTVRAAQAGISLVVSATGANIERADHFEPRLLQASVVPTTGWTWFSGIGPFLGPGSWLVLIGLAVHRRRHCA